VLDDVARVFLETHGDAAEGHGLAAEDVGKTKPHLVAPEVGLDDGAEGLVERLIVVGVRKGEALVGLNGGRGEGGGRTGLDQFNPNRSTGDEHCDRVLDLAQQLRRDGIDAWVDQFEESPGQGWPLWCARQIRN